MVWKILGVILGYVLTGVFIFMTFSAFYLAIGADKAYNPGTFNVSILWIVVSSILGLVAAILGGYVCRRVSGSEGAVYVLAVIFLSLGLAAATVQGFAKPSPELPRTAGMSDYDAMKTPRQPVWLGFLNPVIGFAGMIIGGGVIKKRKEEET